MKREILLYANSDSNADMLYFAGSFIPDNFFAFTMNGKRCAILSPLEIGRARKESNFANIYALQDEIEIFRHLNLKEFLVPKDFPAYVLEKLRAAKLDIKVCDREIFPEREFKSDKEADEIRKANLLCSKSFARIKEILAQSTIDNSGYINFNGEFLTSEMLRMQVDMECLKGGGIAKSTIIASGNQACDPHCVGYGKIKANTAIIADIFPRLNASGYFGDMTRTFVKGKASKEQKKIYKCVKIAHDKVIEKLKDSTIANSVHSKVSQFFDKNGFDTYEKDGQWHGFFHSTGHGVGLSVHESPRLSIGSNILKENMVVTVEPGLYYKGIGACRIEDVVRIRKNDCELLSDFEYIQEIE